MITVAIVSEYNPFHSGHKYQIDKIRETFGEDTAVIAIMSGNYTQRADVAICDKLIRAKCAVDGGVDLVLELPFPYSMSSAEIFASSAVKIANSLNVVDYISFGSESGDIEALEAAAEIMLSGEYEKAYNDISSDKTIGYAKCCELAYREILGNRSCAVDFSPNNILAIEYIKELKRSGSKIKPHTVERIGMGYNETSAIQENTFPSASYLREVLISQRGSLEKHHAPEAVRDILNDAYENGDLPCDSERLAPAVISKFRLNSPTAEENIYDAGGGLYTRLYNASFEANSLLSLLDAATTKKYTNARLRRAMWNTFFGVTSSDVRTSPRFTQVLAMDCIGMKLLKAIKKRSDFHVLTKPSDYEDFDDIALSQKHLSEKADFVFELTKPIPKSAGNALRLTPYIKK